MELMGVYSGGGIFTMPRLGVDGVLVVSGLNSASKSHHLSSLTSDPRQPIISPLPLQPISWLVLHQLTS
jgi:hypothetical protein